MFLWKLLTDTGSFKNDQCIEPCDIEFEWFKQVDANFRVSAVRTYNKNTHFNSDIYYLNLL